MSSVSLIIPTYNRKELLLQTLENLMAQSRIPDEILVIDDKSTDGTAEALKINFPTVKLLTNSKSGPGAARNIGFEASTGDLIKFMDSDDLLTLNSIEDQAGELEQSSASAIYNAYFKASFKLKQWTQEDVIMHYHPIPKNINLKRWVMKGFFIPIPTFMFKREILESAGPWNEEITAYEDFEYFWKLTNHSHKFIHSSRSAMLYRIHGSQTTESNITEMDRVKDKIHSLQTVIELADRELSLNKFEKEFLKVQLRHALVFTSNEKYKTPGGILNKMAELYLRIDKKIGKARTKTDWPPIYGPNASKQAFTIYVAGLKTIQDLK